MAEEHSDNWLAHYYARSDVINQQFTDLPVLGPWMLKERAATGRIYERNYASMLWAPKATNCPISTSLK